MGSKLEKRLQQKDINQTPKVILDELFSYMDNQRCQYEEQELDYHRKITKTQKRISHFQNELKYENYTEQEIKDTNEYIKEQKAEIEKYKREIRLIIINCNILWKNELKMDKVLGYGLE